MAAAYMILEIIVAVMLIGGGLLGLFRWFGKLERNTDATERLTAAFDAFTDRIDTRLTNHETRISQLEGWAGSTTAQEVTRRAL
jgi:hypothetical protein